MEKKKHLVTFATKDFLHSAFLLRRSALLVGFHKVYIFTEKDISNYNNFIELLDFVYQRVVKQRIMFRNKLLN